MEGRRAHQRPIQPTTPRAHGHSTRVPPSTPSTRSTASSEYESSVTPSSPSSYTRSPRGNPATPTRSAGNNWDLQSSFSGLRIAPYSPAPSVTSTAPSIASSIASIALPRGRYVAPPPDRPTAVTPCISTLEDVGDARLPLPLTQEHVDELLIHSENRLVRALFAAATQADRREGISHGAVVHDWYIVPSNTREAVLDRIKQDLWNSACLLDRLTDACTTIHIVEPGIPDGSTFLDPDGPMMKVHVYTPRGVRIARDPVQTAFRLMEEVFRHGIAAQHVRGFLARKEQHMVDASPYRNRSLLTIVNTLPVRAFIAGPAVVDRETNDSWTEADLTATEVRFYARRQFVQRKGVPLLPRLSAALNALPLTQDKRVMITRVVLDQTTSSRPFEDWLLIFRTQFDLSRHDAAHLAMLGADDAEAVNWPL